eukprot:2285920-Alexandrium_andersonii.AAC.1
MVGPVLRSVSPVDDSRGVQHSCLDARAAQRHAVGVRHGRVRPMAGRTPLGVPGCRRSAGGAPQLR